MTTNITDIFPNITDDERMAIMQERIEGLQALLREMKRTAENERAMRIEAVREKEHVLGRNAELLDQNARVVCRVSMLHRQLRVIEDKASKALSNVQTREDRLKDIMEISRKAVIA